MTTAHSHFSTWRTQRPGGKYVAPQGVPEPSDRARRRTARLTLALGIMGELARMFVSLGLITIDCSLVPIGTDA